MKLLLYFRNFILLYNAYFTKQSKLHHLNKNHKKILNIIPWNVMKVKFIFPGLVKIIKKE